MGSLHEGGTVGAMLISAIRRYADRPALADNQTRWTYRELGDAAARLIAFFRSLGLRKGDGVALLATNRVETWAVVTAAAVMGLRYTPLHPLAAEDDHAFIVDDAEALALIVGGERFAERGRAIQRRAPRVRHLLSFEPIEGGRDLLAEIASADPAPLTDEADAEIDLLACLYRRHDRALEGRDDRASLRGQHVGDPPFRLGVARRHPLSRFDPHHTRRRGQHFPDHDSRRLHARIAGVRRRGLLPDGRGRKNQRRASRADDDLCADRRERAASQV